MAPDWIRPADARGVLERSAERRGVDGEAVADAEVVDAAADLAVRIDRRQLRVSESASRTTVARPAYRDLVADRRSHELRYAADPHGFTETEVGYVEHDPPRVDCDACTGRPDAACRRCDGAGGIDCRTCGGDGRRACNRCGVGGVALDWAVRRARDKQGDEPAPGRVDCEHCGGTGVRTVNPERYVDPEHADGAPAESPCRACDDGTVACPRCGGRGELRCLECDADGREPCPACGGGADPDCPACAGRGVRLRPVVGALTYAVERSTALDAQFVEASDVRDEEWTHVDTVAKRDATSADVGGDGIVRWVEDVHECETTRVTYRVDGQEHRVVDVDGRPISDGPHPESRFGRFLPGEG